MASGTIYIDTGGASTNSGTSDSNSPIVSGASGAAVSTTTVTLSGAPDLSGVVADGSQAIRIAGATNTRQKIFWITAVDNTGKTVTVSVAPTGTISNSAWAIGGRWLSPSGTTANDWDTGLRAGDTVQFNNSPASKSTAAFIQAGVLGDAVTGPITIMGKAGTRPLLQMTGSGNALSVNTAWKLSNLELANSSTAAALGGAGVNIAIQNVKISDSASTGFSGNSSGLFVMGCEASGCTTIGLSCSQTFIAYGNYIHDNGGDGYKAGSGTLQYLAFNIIESNAGRGVYNNLVSATYLDELILISNTIYGNGDSGIEFTDKESGVHMFNNIVAENGNASGEYNLDWGTEGNAEIAGYHDYNLFYSTGGGGSGNLLNATQQANELTSDPLFTDAAGGDFSLGLSSPAKASGFPGQFIGGSRSYLDMGAVQRREFSIQPTLVLGI